MFLKPQTGARFASLLQPDIDGVAYMRIRLYIKAQNLVNGRFSREQIVIDKSLIRL